MYRTGLHIDFKGGHLKLPKNPASRVDTCIKLFFLKKKNLNKNKSYFEALRAQSPLTVVFPSPSATPSPTGFISFYII